MMKQYSSSRSWINETIRDERNLCRVVKTLKIDEISPKIDLNDPYFDEKRSLLKWKWD